MSGICSQCLDANFLGRSAQGDVLLREEPDEQDDEEEDEEEGDRKDDDEDEDTDEGYSE